MKGNLKWGGLTVAHPAEYNSYKHARRRCLNPQDKDYKDYGGRGIQFKFESFPQFLTHLGAKPTGTTLERVDNNGHYEPGNVCWATSLAQAKNRRPKSGYYRRSPSEVLEELLVAYAETVTNA